MSKLDQVISAAAVNINIDTKGMNSSICLHVRI